MTSTGPPSDGANAGEPLQAQAIAGARVILIAISANDPALLSGCCGFAIHREALDPEDASHVWLNAASTVSAEPESAGVVDAADGSSVDPCANPIRSFRWSDYTVQPGTAYLYSIYRVLASPTRRYVGPPVVVRARAECEVGEDGSAAYFNRGVAGSQAYARHFGTKTPRDRRTKHERAPWAWLSRGLEEGLLAFIRRASGPAWQVRAAFYELTYAPVLQALADCRTAGADVSFVYDGKLPTWHAEKREWVEHGPCALNDAAVNALGLRDVAIRRSTATSGIPHNKFILLLEAGVPVAVWTGSTNITTSGLFGHFNVGHVTCDPAALAAFLGYWEMLSRDPTLKELAAHNEAASPLPSLRDRGCFTIFSPRVKPDALLYYSDLLRGARQSVFLTAAFGLSAAIAAGLLHADASWLAAQQQPRRAGHPPPPPPPPPEPHDVPTYLLLDNEGRGASPGLVKLVRSLPHAHVACGCYLEEAGMMGSDSLAEHLTELNKHVEYVHTKFLLVDPLSDDPTIVSGSANFSMASTTANDENMLVMRGAEARRMARVFLVEFMRLHSHFAARESAQARAARKKKAATSLAPPSPSSPSTSAATAVADASPPPAQLGGSPDASDASDAPDAELRVDPLARTGPLAGLDDDNREGWWRVAYQEGTRQQRERLLFACPLSTSDHASLSYAPPSVEEQPTASDSLSDAQLDAASQAAAA